MGTGWVVGGLYRVLPLHRARKPVPAKRAPEAPARGLEWVGTGWTRDRRLDGYPGPPCGPGRSCGPPCPGNPRNAASWPIRTRLTSEPGKVSQNLEVSPKYDEKACHSPYLQNGPRKSPLDFLRIPFFVAFSHKELMGLFWPYLMQKCQNDEVSPECTPMDVTRRGRQIPPLVAQTSCSCDQLLI